MDTEIEDIKRRIDIVEFIGSYVTLKKAGTNHKGLCPFHNEKTPSMMVSPEKQIFKCFGCFPVGQLIQAKEGLQEIQNTKIGDLVYTAKGRLKTVDYVFKRPYQGDLLEIVTRMSGNPIKITGDHKVYSIKTVNCKQKARSTRICQKNCRQNCPTKFFNDYSVQKVSARSLKVGDYLLYPVKEFGWLTSLLDLSNFVKIKIKHGKKPRYFPMQLTITEDLARFVGLYLAEGSNHRAYIRFSLGNHEEKLAHEIIGLIQKIFGLDASIHYRQGERTGLEVSCCNSLLSQIMANMCGKGASNKNIPEWLFGQPSNIKESLIQALVDGDGHITRSGKKNVAGRKQLASISQNLIYQTRDLLLGLGHKPVLGTNEARVDNKGVSHRTAYILDWRENDKTHFSDFLEYQERTYWVVPIRKIKKTIFKGDVYNLNVRDDHTYLTTNFAVANCGEGGDVFSFLMKVEGLSFGDAIKILADKAGVKLKPRHFDRLSVGEKPGQKSRMLELQNLAARLYHKILCEHPTAKEAREYLEDRGITKETISNFNLGYAPSSWDLLIRFAESRGFTEKELLVSGLTVRKTSNISAGNRISYDRFRERIVFPINNVLGQTVGFTGRLIKDKDDAPKYLNSSESPIYQKSQVIYGLDKAKLAIKQEDLVVIVEGNMDVIACHQAGFKNVVAVSGTAMTKDMLLVLSRYTFNLAFSFDSDNAGRLALKRAIGMAGELDLNSKVLNLPDKYKDPDEAIKADPKNWERATKEALPALEHLISFSTKEVESIGDKKKVIKEILPTIKMLKNKSEQDHFLRMLAMKLVVSEQSLREELRRARTETTEEEITQVGQKIPEEYNLLAIFAEKPAVLGDDFEVAMKILTESPDLPEELRLKLKDISKNKLSEVLKSSQLGDKLKEVYLGLVKDLEEDVTEEQLGQDLIKKLRKKSYESKKSELVKKISQADSDKDKTKRLQLLKELNSVIIEGD